MSNSGMQRDLLLGHLALELNFINAETLNAAKAAWSAQKGRSLGQILLDRQAISPHTLGVLENLVQLQMAQDASEEEDGPYSQEATLRSDVSILAPPMETGADGEPGVRFRKLRPHAAGALGQVYLARDKELRRKVALKEIKEHYADNPDARSRFLLEAEITGRLEHPGVVPVYGMGTYASGRPFYAMRFIKGQSMADAIKDAHSEKRGPAERAHELRKLVTRFVAVCQTMQYAHDRDIVHRDLKPSNIMLGTYGETLVVDWGLAKVMGKVIADPTGSIFEPFPTSGSSETLPGRAVGTITYMSPEQAAGRLVEVGPASDVYSLGATLFTILTNRASVEDSESPDQGSVNVRKLQKKVLEGAVNRPRKVKPDVDPALEAICVKAMALSPVDRYASARAMADDLERWLANEPVAAWPEPLGRRTRRWIGRHRTLISTAAAAILVGFATTLGFSGYLYQAFTQVQGDYFVLKEYKDKLEAAGKGLAQAQADEAIAKTEAKKLQEIAEEKSQEVSKQEKLLISARVEIKDAESRVEKAKNDVDVERKKTLAQEAFTSQARQQAIEFEKLAKKEIEAADLARDLAKKAGAEVKKNVAVNNMMLAQNRWNEGQVILAHELLETIDPEFRLGGWDFLRRQFEGSYATLHGHIEPVRHVAYSPDGRLIASITFNKIVKVEQKAVNKGSTLKVWDARTGQVLHSLEGVVTFAFNPTGNTLAAALPDGKIRLSGAPKGELIKTSAPLHADEITSLAFSPDGKRLVFASESGAMSWCDANSLDNLTAFKKGHSQAVTSLAFSVDGKQLISTGLDKAVLIWNADTLETAETFMASTNGIAGATFSPGGTHFATATANEAIAIRNLKTKEVMTLKGKHALPVTHVSFSPDGQRVASASFDETVKIWDVLTGQELQTLHGHTKAVRSVSFSPDGQRLASASNDWTLKLWDLTSGHELQPYTGPMSAVACLSFSPGDKQRLAAGTWNGAVHVWHGLAGKAATTIKAHAKEVLGVALSPDGTRVASGGHDGKLKLWDALTGKEVPIAFKGHAGTITSVAFSSDGKLLASAGRDQSVRIWDALTGAETASFKHDARDETGDLTSVAFSADGKRLAWADLNGAFKVWDYANKKEIFTRTEHSNGITSVAFAPRDEYLASAGQDGRVILWDAQGNLVLNLKGHVGGVMSISFSGDGKRLASASKDGTVKLWDARTGQAITTFRGHTDLVTSVVFSPDGKHLVSASLDKTVKLWDAVTAKTQPMFKGQHGKAIDSVAFSGNGKEIYSRDQSGAFVAWNAETGEKLPGIKELPAGAVSSPVSPDGKKLALPVANWFYLVDLSIGSEDSAYRSGMSRPKGWWHRERALRLEDTKARQAYTAAFHWTWAVAANPDDQDARRNLEAVLKLLDQADTDRLNRLTGPALKAL